MEPQSCPSTFQPCIFSQENHALTNTIANICSVDYYTLNPKPWQTPGFRNHSLISSHPKPQTSLASRLLGFDQPGQTPDALTPT